MITTTSNKNLFLLYTLLDQKGLARGSVDSHYLRRKTYDYFRSYEGPALSTDDYGHHSKLVTFVLALEDAPSFAQIPITISSDETNREIKRGSVILSHLKHFYDNTDFEDYYQKMLPIWNEEVSFVDEIVKRQKLDELLDDVWQIKTPMEMVIIPMPLEGIHSGIGPGFNNKSFQVFGPPFDYSCVHLLAHEGSHPRAKLLLRNLYELIETKHELLQKIKENPNSVNYYNTWETYFEEHLIRAVQIAYIDPILFPGEVDFEVSLSHEINKKGMIYIQTFYDILIAHKGESLIDTVKTILEAL